MVTKEIVLLLFVSFIFPVVPFRVYSGGLPHSSLTINRRCPRLRYMLKNGIVKLRNQGRIAKFSCDSDYTLHGKTFATCLRGQWNTPLPICLKSGCSPLDPPINGGYTSLYNGALLTYWCNPGYAIKGSPSVYCDGHVWNDTVTPACEVAIKNPMTSCNFEETDLCGWVDDNKFNNDDFDWKRHQFATPSGHMGTGPSFDHTSATELNGYYLYIETSAPRKPDEKARIFSPVYAPELSPGCFVFWYHMYGTNIGTLRVYVRGDEQVLDELSPVWEKSGEQGNQWIKGTVDIGHMTADFQVVIEGIVGNGYVGDIAIDDVSLRTTGCEEVRANETHGEVKGTCVNRCSADQVQGENETCQCNPSCDASSNCCPDYLSICVRGGGGLDLTTQTLPVPEIPTTAVVPTEVSSESPTNVTTSTLSSFETTTTTARSFTTQMPTTTTPIPTTTAQILTITTTTTTTTPRPIITTKRPTTTTPRPTTTTPRPTTTTPRPTTTTPRPTTTTPRPTTTTPRPTTTTPRPTTTTPRPTTTTPRPTTTTPRPTTTTPRPTTTTPRPTTTTPRPTTTTPRPTTTTPRPPTTTPRPPTTTPRPTTTTTSTTPSPTTTSTTLRPTTTTPRPTTTTTTPRTTTTTTPRPTTTTPTTTTTPKPTSTTLKPTMTTPKAPTTPPPISTPKMTQTTEATSSEDLDHPDYHYPDSYHHYNYDINKIYTQEDSDENYSMDNSIKPFIADTSHSQDESSNVKSSVWGIVLGVLALTVASTIIVVQLIRRIRRNRKRSNDELHTRFLSDKEEVYFS